MNYWTEQSIKYANSGNYLDDLFQVYPIAPNVRRTISAAKWDAVKTAYEAHDGETLMRLLLSFELFPLKDSYVAYFKHDKNAIARNPQTFNRITDAIFKMSLDELYVKCTEPKEANRQLGPLFKRWIAKGTLGAPVCTDVKSFMQNDQNAILNASDRELESFARENLGYDHAKGLDFLARFNKKYVIGEAKFITDFGGHQHSQFADAISTVSSQLLPNKLNVEVIKIAVCDGVLYIDNNSKMHKWLKNNDDEIVLSCLLLKEFLSTL